MSDSEAAMVAAIEARFSNLELIGRGSFGDVFKGFDKELNKEVAIKVIDLEEAEDDIEDIQKEISVLSQCRSPYITDYYGSYLHQTKLWIEMEYMAGGSVADLLQTGPPLDEMSIACILRDLLHALDYLHNEGKIHRDIKAANILLTQNGEVKVADFGVSAQLTKTISRRKLDEHFSRPMKEFVSFCLKKTPAERPSAKELLKHRFIRNARKSPRLLERIRERPKLNLKDGMDTQRNGQQVYENATSTVRVVRDMRDEGTGTIRVVRDARDEGTGTMRVMKDARDENAHSSMDGSQGTGTVRSVVKPPQVAMAREKRSDVSYSPNVIRKTAERENPWMPASGNAFDESNSGTILPKEAESEQESKRLESSLEDGHLSVSGSGTVVIRSSRESQIYAASSSQSTKPIGKYPSVEDMSTSGTVVLHDRHDESETPRGSKSRFGIQEKASSVSHEDSATNLAEAKAALQGGLRRGNARERPISSKHNKDALETKMAERSSNSESSRDPNENIDVQKLHTKSRQSSDVQANARASAAAASPALSLLIIPSLKEATGDKSEGSTVHAVLESLMDLEFQIPGSCEVLVTNLLQRLGSSKESSFRGLHDLAASIFTKKMAAPGDLADGKKQPNAQSLETPSLSPLARFLLSRWQSQVSQDLNSV
uniref:non-specific serine/threonine protein kinase n=1 Tax=Elaeis guineensis var. tenera TaxID=51953 RepID=A0A8N4ICJ2_ELAGV|nr:serine/threonine-protein kinase 10 isoform X2 [Elaeis guineensis]